MKPYDDLVRILKRFKPKKFMIDTTPSLQLTSDNLLKKTNDKKDEKKK